MVDFSTQISKKQKIKDDDKKKKKKTNKMFCFLCKLFMYLPLRYFEMKRKQRDIFSKETFPKKSKKSIEIF